MLGNTFRCMVRLAIDEAQCLLDIMHAGLQHAFKLNKTVVRAYHHVAKRVSKFGHALQQGFTGLCQGFNHMAELANSFRRAVFNNIAQAFCCTGGGDQHRFAVLADLAGHGAAFFAQNVEDRRALIAQFLCHAVAMLAQAFGHAFALLLQVFRDDLTLHNHFHGH